MRDGFEEEGRKVRIISSTAHPDDQPRVCRDSGARNESEGEHFHAVPLSDGHHHILFIDPATERLVLGCDVPFGGPTNLSRKIVLCPLQNSDRQLPRLYSAATDMSHGARIVVAYGDAIVLYSVPPDVLALSRREQAAESRDPFSSSGRSENCWMNWWDGPGFEDQGIGEVWPVCLDSAEIGMLPGVCEVVVQARPEIVVWGFEDKGRGRVWRMKSYKEMGGRVKMVVARRGDVRYGEGGVGFDGRLKRVPRALAVENDAWVDGIDVRGCADAWFEEGGDVVCVCGNYHHLTMISPSTSQRGAAHGIIITANTILSHHSNLCVMPIPTSVFPSPCYPPLSML